MRQNFKVDIIYYLTPSDFEMEFNLCGCCHMRLLTDKATDRKSLVSILARGVSRSRVIIACGPLFKENGLISLVSSAIGSPLEAVDENTYHIKDVSGIEIIKGSTPLITPEGYFGGCIIESGPQTIILLSESKGIRKKIMTSLIHPYIDELSSSSPALPKEESAASDETSNEINASEETEEAEDIRASEEAEEISESDSSESNDESEEVTDDASQSVEIGEESDEVDLEDKDSELTESADKGNDENGIYEDSDQADNTDDPQQTEYNNEDESIEDEKNRSEENQNSDSPVFKAAELEMFVEPEHVKFTKKNDYSVDYTPSENDNMFITEADSDEFSDMITPRKNSRRVSLALIILGIILIVLALLLVYFVIIVPTRENTNILTYLEYIFSPEEMMKSAFPLYRFR